MAAGYTGVRRRHGSLAAAAAALLMSCAHAPATTQPQAATAAQAGQPRAATRFISPFAYEWFVRAELLRARADHAGAIAAYRHALTGAEEDPYVLARLATALDEAGQHAQAQATLEDALALDPHSEAVHLASAEIAARQGHPALAYAAYERAESVAPSSPRAPLALARSLFQAGAPERAIAVLERFEARTLPGSAGAAEARLELALARSDAQGAFEAAAALQDAGGESQAVARTAAALLDAGRPALAWHVLQTLPSHAAAPALSLRAELALGLFDAALARLVASDPETLGGTSVVARAYLQVGRPELALSHAQLLLARNPSDAQALLLQTQAQLALGELGPAAIGLAQLTAPADAVADAVADVAANARAGLIQALRAHDLRALADEIEAARESPDAPDVPL